MLKKIALLLLTAAFIVTKSQAQCIPMNASPGIYNLPCGVSCTNLSFTVPDIRETSDYTIKDIPYQPYAYTTATGNEITSIYIDDQFSAALNCPFPICFYGSTFNQFIVGSNGVVSFDMAFAGCKNAYRVNQPIPFEGTFNCAGITGPSYPKYSIMGPYYDIDPSVVNTSPNRKIEWRIEGVAPCRRLVVSFSEIPLFGSSCNNLLASQQVVIHEATGIVDIFIGNRPTCPSWESGRAILGVQKDVNTALPVPGKNSVSWTESNTGYQYFPTGGAAQLQSVQIIRGGTIIGTGTIGASANGETTVTFPNYCAVTNHDTLEIKAIYKNCGDANEVIFGLDTIHVVKNPGDLLATAAPAPATCTASNGTITVTVPAGAGTPPFEYSLNGGPYQTSNVFTGLASGAYTVSVRDASGTCTSTINVIVNTTNPLVLNTTTTNTSCAGINNGSITVTPSAGTAPYQYSINGGPVQLSNVFTGLAAGTYSIAVTDANGCSRTTFVTVSDGAGIVANVVPVATTCPGVNNGTITINPLSGTSPYQYQLNAGAFQNGNVFTALAPGTYTVTVRDANGCTTTYNNITVATGAGITANNIVAAASCASATNGTITVTPTSGTGPYQYQLNAGAFQPGNIFTGLAPGTYSITVRDANNCTTTYNNIVVGAGAGITATSATTPASCGAATNGSLTVTPASGTAPYQYQLNAGAFQLSNTFGSLMAGPYTVTVRDANNCSVTINVTVPTANGVTATAATVATTCAAATNGSITVNITTGTAPYQYVLDGGASQGSNIFNNVSSGAHTITITDGAGCVATVPANVAAGPGITAAATSAATTCAVAVNGSITVNVTVGTAPYQYSLDGGANQLSNIFNNVGAGNHNITVTDAAGCSRVVPVTVAAGAGITATAVQTPTSCNGAVNGTITVTPAGGNAPYQYSLDGLPPQGSNIFSNVAAGPHTVQVRDANNCTVTEPVSVVAGANLTGTTAITHITCNGSNNGSVTITPTNGNPAYQYAIDGGAFQGSPTFNSLTPGNHTIQLRDANNCSGSVPFTVNEPTAVSISTATTPASCNGQNNGTITITGGGGTPPYQYSINGATFQPASVFNVGAGSYTAYVRDANNCTLSAPVTVTQPGLLVVSATSTNATCNGGANGQIVVTATGGNGGLQYSIDGTTFQTGNSFNTIPGIYTVTVKDANNCSATTGITVGLTNDLILSTRSDTTICESKSVTLTTVSNALSFAWTPGTTLSDSTIKSPVATPSTTTRYIVTAVYGLCSAKDTVIVTVNPAPVADAGPGITICYGKDYQLQGSGGVDYFWRPASVLSNSRIANPVATPRNTTTFYLKVVDANGCESLSEDTAKVIVTPPIVAYAGPDTTITYGVPYQLNVISPNALGAGTSYLWTPSTGLNNSNLPNPVTTLFADQVYSVQIETPEGCKGSASVRLKVYKGPDIFVPTGFSPNGDGRNDVFYVIPVGVKYFDFLRIYNRWGQKVFETQLPAVGWEGRFKSQEQPMDVYIYTVQGRTDKGQVIFKKGSILLIR